MAYKKQKGRTTALFDPIKTMANMTDEVIVGVSGGKDSVVVLELCHQYFKKVHAYFMYLVPGLSFQERAMRYYEARYGIEILRIPHFGLAKLLKYGAFRLPDMRVQIPTVKDSRDYLRQHFGVYWIACGERMSDSMVRHAMIGKSGSIDSKQGRFYPIAYWSKQDVMDYIRIKKLKVGEESSVLGFSFRSLMPQELIKIKHHYPADYEKIKARFPFCEASIKHYSYNPDYYLDGGNLLEDETYKHITGQDVRSANDGEG